MNFARFLPIVSVMFNEPCLGGHSSKINGLQGKRFAEGGVSGFPFQYEFVSCYFSIWSIMMSPGFSEELGNEEFIELT